MVNNKIINNSRPSIFRTIDWWVVGIYLSMLVFGWFSICGASYTYGDAELFDLSSRSGMQIVWICTALALALVIMLLDYNMFDAFAYIVYGVFIIVLFLTIFNPKQIHGSRSWIVMGPIRIQPAEFAKFATALAVAKLMNSYDFNHNRLRHWALAIGMVLVPMLFIILQKETGSALVYLAFFLMFYREGLSGSVLFVGVAMVYYFTVGLKYADINMLGTPTSLGTFLVLLGVIVFSIGMAYVYERNKKELYTLSAVALGTTLFFVLFSKFVIPFNVNIVMGILSGALIVWFLFKGFKNSFMHYVYIAVFAIGSIGFFVSADYVLNDVLKPYQRARINVLLGLEKDITGIGYNVHQSEIAIGSGGFAGKGFLNGTQTKLKYVPEQDTDFIFCTIGEEEGFLGCLAVLLLFLVLIVRIIYLSEQQATRFARVYGYCVASIFTFHIFINIGMVLGMTPVIGIPLPFFSYGGSSLWGFTLLLFIFLRLDAGRKLAAEL